MSLAYFRVGNAARFIMGCQTYIISTGISPFIGTSLPSYRHLSLRIGISPYIVTSLPTQWHLSLKISYVPTGISERYATMTFFSWPYNSEGFTSAVVLHTA